MKTSLAACMRRLSALVLVISLGWALPACSSRAGRTARAAPAQAAADSTTAAPVPKLGVKPPPMVPAPDGSARVLITETAVKLQRGLRGAEEELVSLIPEETAWGALWSPKGTRVCILTEYKRGSGIQVFTTTTQPAAEIELDLQLLELWQTERYSKEYRSGRFYYIKPVRWIDEDHLEIEFSGNLIPREGDGDPETWSGFRGRARVALDAQKGRVEGAPDWLPLEGERDHASPTTPRGLAQP